MTKAVQKPGNDFVLPPNTRMEYQEVPWGPEQIKKKKLKFWLLFSPVLILLSLVVLKVVSMYLAAFAAAGFYQAGNYEGMETAAKIQGLVNVIEPHLSLIHI